MNQQNYKNKKATKVTQLSQAPNTWMLKPLILAISIVILDQVSKLIVLRTIPKLHTEPNDIIRVLGDFIWFINVSNKGAMFSIGVNFNTTLRLILLYILPILLLAYIAKIMLYSSWHWKLRWIAGGIIGGGLGNMIDRVFREDGVVDFISVNIYGLFNMNRWPTFNIADSTIVISMVLWILCSFSPSIFFSQQQSTNTRDKDDSKITSSAHIDIDSTQ